MFDTPHLWENASTSSKEGKTVHGVVIRIGEILEPEDVLAAQEAYSSALKRIYLNHAEFSCVQRLRTRLAHTVLRLVRHRPGYPDEIAQRALSVLRDS